MHKFKRTFCSLLAAFLIIITPVRAYAFAPAIPLAAGSFAAGSLLAVAGVCVGVSAVSVLIGTWDDRDTYMVQGAANKLGSYAQYVYDNARSTTASVAAKYKVLENTLIELMSATWGSVITGILSLASNIREYIMNLVGYGTTSLQVPLNTSGLRSDNFVSSSSCPGIRYSLYGSAGYYINNPDNGFVMSSYVEAGFSNAISAYNFYKPLAVLVYGVYNAVNSTVVFYTSSDGKAVQYEMFYINDDFRPDGSYYSDYSNGLNYGYLGAVRCAPQYVGNIPFKVFRTLEGLQSYLDTGSLTDVYTPVPEGMQTVDVEAVNTGIAELPITSVVDDVITLPVDGDIAAEKWGALQDAFAGDDVSAIDKAIADNIGVTDVPVNPDISIPDEGTNTGDLADVIERVDGLPVSIADELFNRLNDSENESLNTLPDAMSKKFPFCIPFDVAHLVSTLVSTKQVPVFDIPIKFDYLNFKYDRTFVVDMSVYDPAVKTLRVMLDLWFVAGLLSVTRNLIRG